MPIPFLGFGAVVGTFFALNLRSNYFHVYKKVGLFSLTIIFLTFLSNWIHSQYLNYEEIKRLAVIVSSFLFFVFFMQMSSFKRKSTPKVDRLLLMFVMGVFFASIVFWELPVNSNFSSYTWFKFAGSYPLIMLFFIIFCFSSTGHKPIMNLLLGIFIFIFTFIQGAKSTALLAFLVCLLRYRFLSTAGRYERNANKFQSRTRLGIVIFLPVFLFLYVFQRFLELGFFGEKLQATATQYGASLFSSLIRARPEIPFSIQIIQQMPFFGYGTIEEPLSILRLEIINSTLMSYGSQKFLLHRILDSGFNLHSWGIDLLVRGGFLMIIPLLCYLILLLRNLVNTRLLMEYPSLYFVNLTCIQDFFFSPYSWFVSVQIAFSLYSFYLYETGLCDAK